MALVSFWAFVDLAITTGNSHSRNFRSRMSLREYQLKTRIVDSHVKSHITIVLNLWC